MSDTMIWKLANAFGYDIDFAQDLREATASASSTTTSIAKASICTTATSSPRPSSISGKRYSAYPLHERRAARRFTTARTAARCARRSCARRSNSRVSRRCSRSAACIRSSATCAHIGRRLRRADRHADPRGRRRQGHSSAGWKWRLRQLRHDRTTAASHHRCTAICRRSRTLAARPAREPGPDHRLRRHDRPCHRPAPALRIPRRRRASRSAHGHAAEGRAVADDADSRHSASRTRR